MLNSDQAVSVDFGQDECASTEEFHPGNPAPGVEYRDIEGFPGYKIGSDGTVWSCFTSRGPGRGANKMGDTWFQMTGGTVHKQYRMVTIHCNGRSYGRPVHRLVLEAFVGLRPPGMQCRHLNGDSFDCRLDNLKWGTKEENEADRRAHGRIPRGTRCNKASIDEDKAMEIKRLLRIPGIPKTQIAKIAGVSRYIVTGIAKKRTWRHVPEPS